MGHLVPTSLLEIICAHQLVLFYDNLMEDCQPSIRHTMRNGLEAIYATLINGLYSNMIQPHLLWVVYAVDPR